MSAAKETAGEYLARTEPEWERRFDRYDPRRISATWSPLWGPTPDSVIKHPSRPHLQEAWQARRKREKAQAAWHGR